MEAEDDLSVLTDEVEDQEITSLQEILNAFGAPLNEEQAWALCYQCGKYLTEDKPRRYFHNHIDITLDGAGASGVLLAKDGSVYISTSSKPPDKRDSGTTACTGIEKAPLPTPTQ